MGLITRYLSNIASPSLQQDVQAFHKCITLPHLRLAFAFTLTITCFSFLISFSFLSFALGILSFSFLMVILALLTFSLGILDSINVHWHRSLIFCTATSLLATMEVADFIATHVPSKLGIEGCHQLSSSNRT